MSHSLCSRHLFISLCAVKTVGDDKGGQAAGWLVSWLAGPLLTGCDRCHLSPMKRPEGSPHQSHWCQMLQAKHCTHTGMHANINHAQTNNLALKHMQKDAIVIHNETNLYTQVHEYNRIYDDFPFTKTLRTKTTEEI